MSEQPRPVQQPSRKVAGYRKMYPEIDRPAEMDSEPVPPPQAWKPIDYTPKTSLQKKIRKSLKAAGEPTPEVVVSVVDEVLASIKPEERDDALRTALLICVLEVVNVGPRPRGKLGGEPKVW